MSQNGMKAGRVQPAEGSLLVYAVGDHVEDCEVSCD